MWLLRYLFSFIIFSPLNRIPQTFLHYDKKAAQSRAAALMEADRANGMEVPDVLDIHMEGVNGQTFSHFWKVSFIISFEAFHSFCSSPRFTICSSLKILLSQSL